MNDRIGLEVGTQTVRTQTVVKFCSTPAVPPVPGPAWQGYVTDGLDNDRIFTA